MAIDPMKFMRWMNGPSPVSYTHLLEVMNTPGDIIDDAWRYIVVIYYGIGAAIFYNMISGIIRAVGDSRTPLYFLIIACIINIILDYAFIAFFGMGVAGAGWATVIEMCIRDRYMARRNQGSGWEQTKGGLVLLTGGGSTKDPSCAFRTSRIILREMGAGEIRQVASIGTDRLPAGEDEDCLLYTSRCV